MSANLRQFSGSFRYRIYDLQAYKRRSCKHEVGDGACLLRTLARRALVDPKLHGQVRHAIVNHIRDGRVAACNGVLR